MKIKQIKQKKPKKKINKNTTNNRESLIAVKDNNNNNNNNNNNRTDKITGTFQSTRQGYAFLCPDTQKEPDIFIPADKIGDAVQGDRVAVKISRKRSGKRREGEVVSIIKSAKLKLEEREEFPSKVLKELEKLPNEEDIVSIAEREGRRDLRETTIVTIDPETARDIDDGISLSMLPEGGYILGVHIADVSHYVREGTALHREALKRATSIYLVDRVIHMLPPLLSQNLCSLREQRERLAVSVEMELNHRGDVENYTIFPSLIKVKHGLSYKQVEEFIVGDKEASKSSLSGLLSAMDDLALMLKQKRVKKGALDLNVPETKVVLDDSGKPVSVDRKTPGRAESIIEEFMLMANEVVAEHFSREGVPFIYRVHPQPTEEKMIIFRNILSLIGIKVPGDLRKIKPRKIQGILEEVRGTPLDRTVNYILLRSLPQAYYSVINEPHFGLASKYYTHFTSPIRRFPDMQIHAIIKEHVNGGISEKRVDWLQENLTSRAEHSSRMERVAMEAERDSVDHKKIEFMEGKEGEEYCGVISGVTSFGLFVELENTVEGLILLEDLTDDYYRYFEGLMMVRGKKTRKQYRLGDPVKVLVDKVDSVKNTVYFKLN